MKKLLLIALLIVGCDNSTEPLPEDCAGVAGGDAVFDECGECGGDGIDEGACDCDGNWEDCAGECDGDAMIDCMGECGGYAVLFPDGSCY